MTSKKQPYRVLARKYRPASFNELIGQDALVRTLTNAIESGRIAHAFMLTGIRGVGKTTTARIIAKALNYKGPDGKAEPTAGDTSDCPVCQAIGEDRHPDVIEMDAASHTGIDNIREILDGVRYAPTEARYKIYIIDEVHMLSKQAFNALLKTLEEPPEHVKFIFATTEIRKVPITVLSRCQRFDLKRVDRDKLIAHFSSICEKEGIKAEDEALSIIAGAADGSVRDGLSLLDQAIALSGETITGQQVRDMIGLADQGLTLDILEDVLKGQTESVLKKSDALYKSGCDPLTMVQDLLSYVHILSRYKVLDTDKAAPSLLDHSQNERLQALSSSLGMPALGKAWQILLKGIEEVQTAPVSASAADMILIRLCYASQLPDPADLIKKLKKDGGGVDAIGSMPSNVPAQKSTAYNVQNSNPSGAQSAALNPSPDPSPVEQPVDLSSLEAIVSFLNEIDEVVLASHVYHHVRLVTLKKNSLVINLTEEAPDGLIQSLRQTLSERTGVRWMLTLADERGAPTLYEQQMQKKREKLEAVKQKPEIKEIMKIFPEAKIIDITTREDHSS